MASSAKQGQSLWHALAVQLLSNPAGRFPALLRRLVAGCATLVACSLSISAYAAVPVANTAANQKTAAADYPKQTTDTLGQLYAAAGNHWPTKAEIAIWLSYRSRQNLPEAQAWQVAAAANLKKLSHPDPNLAVPVQLLGCYLSYLAGLYPSTPDCLGIQPQVAALNHPQLRVVSWHMLGNLLLRSGDVVESLATNQLARSEADSVGLQTEIATIENSLGMAYLESGLPLKAFEHFEAAHDALAASPNPLMRQVLAFNVGISHLEAQQFEAAADTFTTALPWIEANNRVSRKAIALTYLAKARIGLGEASQAVGPLAAFLDSANATLDRDSYLLANTALAEAMVASGDVIGGISKLASLLAEAKVLNSKTRSTQIRIQLAKAQFAADEPAAALATLADLSPLLNSAEPSQNLYQALQVSANSQAALGNYAAAFADQAKLRRAELMAKDETFKTQIALLQARLDRDQAADELMMSQQREQALLMETKLNKTISAAAFLLSALLLMLAYLLLSRHFQKRLAEREREASQQLEAQVVERTHALESTMAERLNVEEDRRLLQQTLLEGEKLRALGQLTGGVAHDFNNLMTVVTLSAELLKEDLPQHNARAIQSLDDILRAAQSAADITAGLLAYARQQPLQPEPLELQQFVTELMPLFERSLDETIELRLNAPQRCQVLVDRSQLTTCLLNLLLNAKEAIADGGRIVITVEPKLPRFSNMVTISVTDNGCGMSSGQVKRATDPFYSTKPSNQGSGLGLSMVYGFAKQSGGDLSIISTEHLGTEITISLPTAATAQKPASDIIVSEPKAAANNARVLVIEDQPEVRDVLQRLLESLGLEVAIAVDGTSGREHLIEHGAPDLLITDIVMPGDVSGLDIADFAHQRFPHLAILIISGYTESNTTNFPFLRKPFTLNELRSKVTTLLAEPAQPIEFKPRAAG